jgi:uncharacterized protein YaiI (UPF0178 family)
VASKKVRDKIVKTRRYMIDERGKNYENSNMNERVRKIVFFAH